MRLRTPEDKAGTTSFREALRSTLGDVEGEEEIISRELPASLLLSVHDELLMEAKEDYAEDVRQVMAEGMRTASGHSDKWRVPILVDAKIGHNWAEAH